MDLSDEKTLECILQMWKDESQPRKRKARALINQPQPAYETPRLRSVRRRCHCGVCRKCQENAHWERVFHEKFEDPDYYKGRPLPLTSPLSDL